MGRPQINIDKKSFEKLCALQCTLVEFADFFDCSEDTIERWCKRTYKKTFAEVFKKKRGKGLVSLRRTQWRLAETSTAMAIFLGKNYLGQTDKQTTEITGTTEAQAKFTELLEQRKARRDDK